MFKSNRNIGKCNRSKRKFTGFNFLGGHHNTPFIWYAKNSSDGVKILGGAKMRKIQKSDIFCKKQQKQNAGGASRI